MNKLYQSMQSTMTNQNPFLANVKNMMNMTKSSGNPQMFLQQMMSKNPQVKQAMEMVQSNGGDAKSLFYALAKQKGIDPNTILNQLR